MKIAVLALSLLALLLVALPGPLYKFELVSLGAAFTSLRMGVYVGAAALLVVIVQAVFFRKSMSIAPITISVISMIIAVGIPISMMQKATAVPAIHDITTDVLDPPLFIAVLPLRENSPNPPEYGGSAIAEQQKKAYPDLQTQSFNVDIKDVIDAARLVINDLGWQLATEGALQNTLEATDETAWFGFKDDIVIRFVTSDGVTLVDVRSKSRVGRSDLGANAERIRDFQEALVRKL